MNSSSSSSFSSSKDGQTPEMPPEDDCEVRKAEVSIYVAAATGVNGTTSTYQHWTLVFEFEDGTVRVIEGVNFNDVLLPSFSKVKDPRAKYYKRRGNVTISPEQIRDLALNNPYNFKKYDLLTCNCHIWANVILERLGFEKKKTFAKGIS